MRMPLDQTLALQRVDQGDHGGAVDPRPPILIGGYSERTLRVVAEHADIWNVPGPPFFSVEEIRSRARMLDDHCAAIGRDPNQITRSAQIFLSSDDPAPTRAIAAELIDAGVRHLVLAPRDRPYPRAQWIADEVIAPVLAEVP
jgi:alkanesulfonate monooxygenase SsuD/methylene tetrahydromethanopterin reductase-like flavin-dependent oxidoreductase (luciferase family)